MGYNFLEHIYPAKEEEYNKFIISSKKNIIKDKLNSKIFIISDYKQTLKILGINFEEREDKIEIIIKDFIILYIGEKLKKFHLEQSYIRNILNKLNSKYFNNIDQSNNYSLLNILLFHISNLLTENEVLCFGIFDGLEGFYQHRDILTIGDIDKIYRSRIQIDVSQFIFDIMNPGEEFNDIEPIFSLNLMKNYFLKHHVLIYQD